MPVLETYLQNPFLVILVTAWSLGWKGYALWRAAKLDQKRWYIALLVINTIGILEIVYLTWFVKKDRFWDKIINKYYHK